MIDNKNHKIAIIGLHMEGFIFYSYVCTHWMTCVFQLLQYIS